MNMKGENKVDTCREVVDAGVKTRAYTSLCTCDSSCTPSSTTLSLLYGVTYRVSLTFGQYKLYWMLMDELQELLWYVKV